MALSEEKRWEAIENIMKTQMVHIEFMKFFLGDLLGSGTTRWVFENRQVPSQVVKIDMAWFSNVHEHQVWDHVKAVDKVSRWFAPCFDISPCGCIMTQAKCKPVPRDCFPDKVPKFLTDLKRANFGLYKGRVVCLDYGNHLMLEHGMHCGLRKADWWDLCPGHCYEK